MERKNVAQAAKASSGRIEHTDAILGHKQPKLSALNIEESVDNGEEHVARALKASTGRIEHTDAILRHKPKLSALNVE